MGEIKYNGRTYSGLIQANGCFVDTDNVIVSATPFTVSMSYTATQDCYIGLYIVGVAGSDVTITIDNEYITSFYYNAVMGYGIGYFLKKGQTFSITGVTSQYNSNYVVYGLMQGSPITFLSEYASACYDTNEREVGCWIDGKPIYQRTVEISNVSYDSNWHDVAHGISNVESIVQIKGIIKTTSNYFYNCDVARPNTNLGVIIEVTSTNISYLNSYVDNPDKLYVTLLYTKTTDTAGSGKLTPTGFETHHYSTNEQIVGTWIDGKPLYEVTVEVDNPTINSYSTKKYVEAPYSSSVIDFAKCVSCTVYDSTDSRWYTLPYERMLSSENINIQAMRLSNGSFAMTAHWDSSNSYNVTKIRYTIQFTKTTD